MVPKRYLLFASAFPHNFALHCQNHGRPVVLDQRSASMGASTCRMPCSATTPKTSSAERADAADRNLPRIHRRKKIRSGLSDGCALVRHRGVHKEKTMELNT